MDELDEANATLARLHAEHEALRKKLGEGDPPSRVPHQVAVAPQGGPGGGAYRGGDEATDRQRALEQANGAVANQGIENAILQSRLDERTARQAKARQTLLIALAATVGIMGVVWLYVAHGGPTSSMGGIGPTLFGFIALARLLGFKKPSERG